MRLPALRDTTFLANERGTISIMFGAAIIAVVGFVGLSIDVGRSMDAHSKAASALDAAALAATRAVFSGDKSVAEIETLAADFFESNLQSVGDIGADYSDFTADVDTDTKTVKVQTVVHVPTTFGRIFGIDKVNYTVAARATFNVQDIELSLVLDITGSMCTPCSKIGALKDAATELVDTLMPENGGGGDVKIALAPYSASVNVGAYSDAATDGLSLDHCAYERTAHAYKDTAPGPGKYFRAANPGNPSDIDAYQGNSTYSCPDSEIVPLTQDREMLETAIDNLSTGGWTAGHIGAAWGWYMISDKWAGIFTGASAPQPYGTENLIKAVVLMTDGDFNTAWANGSSASQAISICDAMKDEDVIVYAVSFQSPNHPTLQACASTDNGSGDLLYWDANNSNDLIAAFKDIAIRLTNLRLDK
ncbi:MAG: pilus assembly protein TadG-related protein [Hyphomicrobiaceae bacterium]